ncbi:MAG: tRNA epoxyqueuosine(34) reductase QueG [Candidatus Eiseniibacteriota bacterium]
MFPDRPSRADGTTGVPDDAPLRERIQAEARRLGFEAVGFARAEAHSDAERLRAWLAEGRHGTMSWMARDPDRRGDPRRVLRVARTVISVGLGYYSDAPAPPASPLLGRIARYAWGRDYHKRMRKRLIRLSRAIQTLEPAARCVPYVDTGPCLDRAWAERAGLGWIGKNTNVILKSSGSWHFLGEILTNLDLAPDPPAQNYCGTCVRCIEACPTGAIVAPYQLDARRCISYLTIEHKGPIPLELRPAVGTRIFGCDDCQDVCPWNRFATPTANPDFAARPEQQTPELIPLLDLDNPGFLDRYQGTAIRRAGRDRFVRNVAVALGNLADPRAVPALSQTLRGDASPMVRAHAAWALGRIGTEAARAALHAARDESPDVRREIDYALETRSESDPVTAISQGGNP